MTIHRLCTRVTRLEQHAQAHAEGSLHVWRLPDASGEEAFDRYEVDPNDSPAGMSTFGQGHGPRLAWRHRRPRSGCRGRHQPLPSWSAGYTRV